MFIRRGKVTVKEKERTAIIEGNEYKLEEYYTELENREAYMKKLIIENIRPTQKLRGRNEEPPKKREGKQ